MIELTGQGAIFIAWLDGEQARRGWNDFQVARRAGLSHSVISKARRGVLPRWQACEALAAAFGLPAELVFRQAGLLPPLEEPPGLAEWRYLLTALPEHDRIELLQIARLKLELAGGRGPGTRRPGG